MTFEVPFFARKRKLEGHIVGGGYSRAGSDKRRSIAEPFAPFRVPGADGGPFKASRERPPRDARSILILDNISTVFFEAAPLPVTALKL